jgi:hypothetical protein
VDFEIISEITNVETIVVGLSAITHAYRKAMEKVNFAALYTDEDMSALVATLLRSRGLYITTAPEQATLGKTDSEQIEVVKPGCRTLNRNQGYGYEATQLALNFAFNELNLHRVQFTVFSYNQASIALCEKCGFRHEGIYREFIQRDGKRYDMYLYGIVRHKWEVNQDSYSSPLFPICLNLLLLQLN